jgi:WD40 repeat protein
VPLTGSFQDGGALRVGSFYATRPADEKLTSALLAGELCYVLAPRQMGKSSLRARVTRELRAQGVRCAGLDLTLIGAHGVAADAWFHALVEEVGAEIGLVGVDAAWLQTAGLPPVARWVRFLTVDLLAAVDGRIVVFVDEIDSVVGLQGAVSGDELLASIRAVVGGRADHPDWARLTFCLLGVVAPHHLILDPVRTPFNIGQAVPLDDLTPSEAAVFLPGLAPLGPLAEAVLEEAWSWTHGDPYLLQRLCKGLLARGSPFRDGCVRVEEVVRELFLDGGPSTDIHLASAAERVLGAASSRAMLDLYRRVRAGAPVAADPRDPLQLDLRLAGMVTTRGVRQPALVVRNRVFAEVFDLSWVDLHAGRRELAALAAAWATRGRRPADLLRGETLQEQRALAEARGDLTPEESELLLASVDAETAQAALDERRANTERALQSARRSTRRIAILAGLLGLAALAAALLYVRLENVGGSVRELTRRRTELWAESALLAAGQAGSERDALTYALRAVGAEREATVGREWLTAGTSRAAHAAVAAASRASSIPYQEHHSGSVEWSPDGRAVYVAVGGRVRTWTMGGGSSGPTWEADREELRWAGPSPDGTAVATVGEVDGLRVWEDNGRIMRCELRWADEALTQGRWSPDGSRIVVAGERGGVEVVDANTCTASERLPGLGAAVWGLDFHPSGHEVAAASMHGVVRTWSLPDGLPRLDLRVGSEEVIGLRYSPDGTVLAAATAERTSIAWDTTTGKLLWKFLSPGAFAVILAFSPDGALLAAGGADGVVHILDPRTGMERAVLRGHRGSVSGVAWAPKGRRLASAAAGSELRIWRPASSQSTRAYVGDGVGLECLTWSPDGARIAVGGKAGRLRVLDAETLIEVATPQPEDPSRTGCPTFRDDGGLLVAWHDGALTEHDGNGARSALARQAGRPGRLTARTGKRLAVVRAGNADTGGTATLWVVDTYTGAPINAIRTDAEVWEGRAALSPDGTRVAAATAGFDAAVWDVASGRELFRLQGQRGFVSGVAWSPDGRWLATASRDGLGRVWEVTAAGVAAERELVLHRNWLTDVAFSPDSRWVVTSSVDGTAARWESATGDLWAVYEDASDMLESTPGAEFLEASAFAPDGSELALTGGDGQVRVYPVASAGVLDRLCTLAARWDVADTEAICGRLGADTRDSSTP